MPQGVDISSRNRDNAYMTNTEQGAENMSTCDWGSCTNRADYIFSARATNVPGGADATAERRPTCWKHACEMSQRATRGTFELWHNSGQLLNV